jgi:hypothetical protein
LPFKWHYKIGMKAMIKLKCSKCSVGSTPCVPATAPVMYGCSRRSRLYPAYVCVCKTVIDVIKQNPIRAHSMEHLEHVKKIVNKQILRVELSVWNTWNVWNTNYGI